jgi:outer membrane protein TolC
MAENGHPEIIKIRTKGIQLSLEKKLASEQLKPTLNLSYNVLDYLPIVSSEYQPNYFANNYKIGAAFSLPLFLRKERGKLKLTSLKIEQNDWEAKQTNREIQNQIRAVYQVLENMSKMIVTQNEMVINYSLLRDAELDKFSIGESSLFLVNSRETKLLEALLKQRDLERKIYKAEAELYWAAGVGRNFRQ